MYRTVATILCRIIHWAITSHRIRWPCRAVSCPVVPTAKGIHGDDRIVCVCVCVCAVTDIPPDHPLKEASVQRFLQVVISANDTTRHDKIDIESNRTVVLFCIVGKLVQYYLFVWCINYHILVVGGSTFLILLLHLERECMHRRNKIAFLPISSMGHGCCRCGWFGCPTFGQCELGFIDALAIANLAYRYPLLCCLSPVRNTRWVSLHQLPCDLFLHYISLYV